MPTRQYVCALLPSERCFSGLSLRKSPQKMLSLRDEEASGPKSTRWVNNWPPRLRLGTHQRESAVMKNAIAFISIRRWQSDLAKGTECRTNCKRKW